MSQLNGTPDATAPDESSVGPRIDIPDELLDAIFVLLNEAIYWYPDAAARKTWKACSLVCKRWHNIALPHVFGAIKIYEHEITPTSPCVQFFTKNPTIASLVQCLALVNIEMQDTEGLDHLLGALPSLYCLYPNSISIGSAEGTLEQPLRFASHSLERFVYSATYSNPKAQLSTFVRLLSLFSSVWVIRTAITLDYDNFEDDLPTEEDVDDLVSQTLSTRPGTSAIAEFQSLDLRCQDITSGFFIPSYLLKLGAAKNLAYLSIAVTYISEWQSLLDLVSASHSTLQFLHIDITGQVIGIEDKLDLLQPILSTCCSLEEIILMVSLPFSIYTHTCTPHPDGIHLCHLSTSHELLWLAFVHVLQSIPRVAPLYSAKIGLRGTCTDPHILDWHQLSEWCRSRVSSDDPDGDNLRTGLDILEVELHQPYDQSGCMAYEMRELIDIAPKVFEPKFDVPGEHGRSRILLNQAPPWFNVVEFGCLDEGCRRYRGVCPVE